MKHLIIWIAGFVMLIVVNFIVEFVLLPIWGLDNTPKNDIYFKLWWVAIGIWFLYGIKVWKSFMKNNRNKKEDSNSL